MKSEVMLVGESESSEDVGERMGFLWLSKMDASDT